MRTRPIATIAAGLTMLMIAGCGSSGESSRPAAQILRDAQAAAQAADSVHISGTVVRGTSTATIALVLTSSGDGSEKITSAGQTISVVRVGPSVWVQGLGGGPNDVKKLAVTDPQAAPLVAQVDKKTVFDQLIKSGDTPAVTGSSPVGDQAAVQITPAEGAGVLSVADDTGHPYPLEVRSGTTGDGPGGTLTFTEWNAHSEITPPASAGS